MSRGPDASPSSSKIFAEEFPPDAYYKELGRILQSKFFQGDSKLVEHVIPLVAAFDTATAFALSFSIANSS